MQYYRHLYLTEGLKKKKSKIIEKLENNKFQMNIHIVTLANNKQNHLDALEVVEEIVQEVYNETKGADIRSYILRKEQEE